MSMNIWDDTPTKLDLNGPIMSIVTQPIGVTTTHRGTATFTGLATATFPTGITGSLDGTIAYQWYDQTGALGVSTQWSGQTTNVLTILDAVSPEFHNKQYYFTAKYIPSAYGTAGAAKSTGNAINEPVTSGLGTLSVRPGMRIATGPSSVTSIINNDATFNVVGELTDTTQGEISYQWTVNGNTASNGVTQTTSSVTTFVTNYTSDATVVIPEDATNVKIRISAGAGGYGGSDTNGNGGSGGSGRSGTFTLPDGGRTLDLFVGVRGGNNSTTTATRISLKRWAWWFWKFFGFWRCWCIR